MEQNRQEPEIKVGAVSPASAAEIIHQTPEGQDVRLAGFVTDPEDSERLLATRYTFDLDTGEAGVEHGHIKQTPIREAAQYVWEHKKSASAVVSTVVTVALGSLWVRHKRKQ